MDFFPQPVEPLVPLRQMTVFVEGPDHPEGLAFDDEGALWAGSEAGQIYRRQDGKTEQVANVDGPHRNDLFVANLGRWHITCIPTGTAGQPLANQLSDRNQEK